MTVDAASLGGRGMADGLGRLELCAAFSMLRKLKDTAEERLFP